MEEYSHTPKAKLPRFPWFVKTHHTPSCLISSEYPLKEFTVFMLSSE